MDYSFARITSFKHSIVQHTVSFSNIYCKIHSVIEGFAHRF